jgi:hypothetical protein
MDEGGGRTSSPSMEKRKYRIKYRSIVPQIAGVDGMDLAAYTKEDLVTFYSLLVTCLLSLLLLFSLSLLLFFLGVYRFFRFSSAM